MGVSTANYPACDRVLPVTPSVSVVPTVTGGSVPWTAVDPDVAMVFGCVNSDDDADAGVAGGGGRRRRPERRTPRSDPARPQGLRQP